MHVLHGSFSFLSIKSSFFIVLSFPVLHIPAIDDIPRSVAAIIIRVCNRFSTISVPPSLYTSHPVHIMQNDNIIIPMTRLEEMNPLSPDIISLKALGFCVLFFIHDKLTMIYFCYQSVQILNFYKIL